MHVPYPGVADGQGHGWFKPTQATVLHGPDPICLNQRISNNSNLLRFEKYKTFSSPPPKLLKFFMVLDSNIKNNFQNWVNFKFSTEVML
jgi:hypothetical protein